MNFKKFGKALIFPHIGIMLALIPVSTAFLIYSMIYLKTESVLAIISFVLSFYTLVVWCIKIPRLITFFKNFKQENTYAKLWFGDAHVRVRVSLYGSLMWNTAYAVFMLILGRYHHTFWFYSIAWYYLVIAVMRFFLLRHTSKHTAGEDMIKELKKYRVCGVIFLLLNLTFSVIVFFMVYWNRTFNHHEVTTIAMAAYTFSAFTIAIVNIVRYRKYNSPVYSAAKAISLASACVSMLTLESTMLTTFNDGSIDTFTRRIFLGISGAAISIFIIVMAVFMIVQSNKKLKNVKEI